MHSAGAVGSRPVVIPGPCELVCDVDRLNVLLVLLKRLNGALVEYGIGSLVALRVDQEGRWEAERLSLFGLGAVMDLHNTQERGGYCTQCSSIYSHLRSLHLSQTTPNATAAFSDRQLYT